MLFSQSILAQYTNVINANRPGFSESPYSVGSGVYQLETSVFYQETKIYPTFSRPQSKGVDFLFRTSIGFNMLFLEEIWSRNFTNLFIAPMKISEIIVSLVFTALIRALIGLVPAILLTSPLFGISLLDLGLPLAFLFLSLYIFGITLGLFVSAGLLRFGPSFENIAWSTMFLLAPFGCIYYPVETLPEIFQSIAYALPLVYIFEETRNILVNQSVNYENIIQALYFNCAYLIAAVSVFYYSFDKAREKGTLINIGE
mgnify:CR=1 FL=1